MRAKVGLETFRIDFRHEDGEWLRRAGKPKKKLDQRMIAAAQSIGIIERILANQQLSETERFVLESARGIAGQLFDVLWEQQKNKLPVIAKKRTVARIVLEHGDHEHVIAVGEAYVSPSDNFNKETGRQIALARALVGLEERLQGPLRAAYTQRQGSKGWFHSPEAMKAALRSVA